VSYQTKTTRKEEFDLDALLHPAEAFEHPSQVLADPDLTTNEKRAILASWASDACAVEAMPDLRAAPNGSKVKFDDIMDALRQLDGEIAETQKYRKFMRRARLLRGFGGRDSDPGQTLQ
jgi:hypothetical protein